MWFNNRKWDSKGAFETINMFCAPFFWCNVFLFSCEISLVLPDDGYIVSCMVFWVQHLFQNLTCVCIYTYVYRYMLYSKRNSWAICIRVGTGFFFFFQIRSFPVGSTWMHANHGWRGECVGYMWIMGRTQWPQMNHSNPSFTGMVLEISGVWVDWDSTTNESS